MDGSCNASGASKLYARHLKKSAGRTGQPSVAGEPTTVSEVPEGLRKRALHLQNISRKGASRRIGRVIVGDPNLDPGLRARADSASDVVRVVLAAAERLRHNDSLSQIHALALHATIIEQFSACILLAQFDEANTIPIILRSMYEAVVDLDNLLRDAGYLERMEGANIEQTLKIMKGRELRAHFKEAREEDFDQLGARLTELVQKGKGPLSIRARCETAGRLGEYEGIYGLFCLDTHNNASALFERHISELPDGSSLISFFRKCDPQVVANRLDFGLQWLFQSARMTHGAFQVPAPEVEALAARFEHERRERLAAASKGGAEPARGA
jgi:Family of unknown function (DUF5677)